MKNGYTVAKMVTCLVPLMLGGSSCKEQSQRELEEEQLAAYEKAQQNTQQKAAEASQAAAQSDRLGAGAPPPPPGARPQDPAAQGASASLSPEQLDRFVLAQREVRQIQTNLAERVARAEPDEARKLQLEAGQKLQEKLGKLDMTIPEYEKLAERVGSTPALQAKVEKRLRTLE